MPDHDSMPIYHGGLMRCCLDSIVKHMDEGGAKEDGTVIGCRHHSDPNEPTATVINGAWHWVGPKTKER